MGKSTKLSPLANLGEECLSPRGSPNLSDSPGLSPAWNPPARLALFHYLSLSTWVRRLALPLMAMSGCWEAGTERCWDGAMLGWKLVTGSRCRRRSLRLRWFIFPLSRCNIIRHKYIRRLRRHRCRPLTTLARMWREMPSDAQGCNISYVVKWAKRRETRKPKNWKPK